MFNGLFETGGAILLSTVIAYDDNSRLDNIYVIRTEYDSIFKCDPNFIYNRYYFGFNSI